jgi:ppGpp synthetase/RelA/SpoT-type nucleotidyltranferase
VTDSPSLGPADLYDLLLGDLESLREEALHCLRESGGLRGLKIHSISGRVKSRVSFLEKIDRKKYRDPMSDTDDLVGLRIVCLFTDDLPKLASIINEEFDVLAAEDKVADADVASFGYMSQHYVCRLRPEFHGRRYDRIKGQKFEIQCRTLLMDAWANVSHHLAYKGESSIPQALRKDFHALSGLLYVADRQFQALLTAAKESQDEAVQSVADALNSGRDRPLDLSAMQAFLVKTFPDRRKETDAIWISELVEELAHVGITTVHQLQEIVRQGLPYALSEEEDAPEGIRMSPVALVRQSLLRADENYAEFYLRKLGLNRRSS